MGTAATALSLLGCVAAIGIASAALLREAPAATASAPAAPVEDARIPALERRVAELTTQLEAVRQQQSAKPAAATASPDDERIKAVVQAELREQMNRFRQGMGGGAPQDPQEMRAELAKEVQVDAEKAEKLAVLVETHRATVRELFRNGQDREQATAKMQEERKKLEAASAETLSAEEQQRFTAWLQTRLERGGRGRGRGQGGGGGAPPGEAPQRGTSF